MPTNRKNKQDDDQVRDDTNREFDMEDEEQGGARRSSQQTSADQGGNRPGPGQTGNQGRGSSNTKKRK